MSCERCIFAYKKGLLSNNLNHNSILQAMERISRPLVQTRQLLATMRKNYWRSLSTKMHHRPPEDDGASDFRPPWAYITSRLASYTIIPGK